MIARLLSLAGGLPITAWIIAGLLVALGGLEVTRRVQVSDLRAEANMEKAGRAQDHADADAAALRQAAAHARETNRRLERQQELQNVHDKELAAVRADRDAARAVSLRLSTRLGAIAASARGAASDPAASVECKATAADTVVLTDVLERAGTRLRELAEHADASRAAGQLCAAAFDSLTLKPAGP